MASEFHNLLVAELPRLRGLALVLTRSRPASDDLLQQTALKAWQYRNQFQLGTNFKAWISRIMRNEHISSFRTSKRAPLSIEGVSEAVLECRSRQEDQVLTHEVLLALDRLSTSHREVLVLVCGNGLEYGEAAQTLGCSVGTIKSRLFRARQQMQTLLLSDSTRRSYPPDSARDHVAGCRERLTVTVGI